MAFIQPRDRVAELSTSNSQTVFALGGALNTSFNAFSASMAVGDVTVGGVVEDGVAFKAGMLTLTGANEITVTTITESKGTFSPTGTKRVFMGLPSAMTVIGPMTFEPQGRLTLTSGVAVMNATVAAATAVYYTPSGGDLLPIYTGTNFTPVRFSERTNILADGATGNAGPAAVVPNANYDMYAWVSGASLVLSRSDYWKKSNASVSITAATPGVVTWTGNDFDDGAPIVFASVGTISNLTAGVTYYVKQTSGGVIANTFNLATTPGGAAINTTGSTATGLTATASDKTGAVALASGGNCERQSVNGLLLNKNAITNGPAAARGTYLGTIRTNGTATVDFQFGGVAAGGLPVKFGVWNMFKRNLYKTFVGDSSQAWQWLTANQWRVANAPVSVAANGFINMGGYAIRGLDVDCIEATYEIAYSSNAGSVVTSIGIGVNTAVTFSGTNGYISSTPFQTGTAKYSGLMGQGWSYVAPLEFVSTSTGGFFSGNGSIPLQYQSGMHVEFWQ